MSKMTRYWLQNLMKNILSYFTLFNDDIYFVILSIIYSLMWPKTNKSRLNNTTQKHMYTRSKEHKRGKGRVSVDKSIMNFPESRKTSDVLHVDLRRKTIEPLNCWSELLEVKLKGQRSNLHRMAKNLIFGSF